MKEHCYIEMILKQRKFKEHIQQYLISLEKTKFQNVDNKLGYKHN